MAETQEHLRILSEKSPDGGAELLNREDMEQIRALQERVLELRKALRSVQSVLSRDILAMQTKIMILNILLVPVLSVFAALFIAWRRRSRRAVGFGKEGK